MNETLEIIIAGLSVIIACMQLRLSKQINKQEVTKEKGYFIIEKTNLRKKDDKDYAHFAWLYDLKNALLFKLWGNGDVFILKEQIIVNNVTVKDNQPLETFFSIYDHNSYFGILLPLKANADTELRLDVEIILKLRNIMGNVYFEKILLEFTRNAPKIEWTLHKMNTSFEFK